MKRDFTEGLRNQMWEAVLQEANTLADYLDTICESPIETDFGIAFCIASDLLIEERVKFIKEGNPLPTKRCFYLRPQYQIEAYRVDFLAGVSWGAAEAIVECDGREFHHSTREQIERDRARDKELEAANYKVFRFPGAEIYRVPLNCAITVMNWLITTNGEKQ